MDTSFVFTVVAAAGLLMLAANIAGRSAEVIGWLFYSPDLGWPHGVQEDDDLTWRWRPPIVPDGRASPPSSGAGFAIRPAPAVDRRTRQDTIEPPRTPQRRMPEPR